MKKTYRIALLPGDGIGPEVTDCAVKVLNSAAEKYGFSLCFDSSLIGGAAIDGVGAPLPDETLEKCKRSECVLLGAVGGYKWDALEGDKRPEAGLLAIRKELGLFANLRPATVWEELKAASPLKSEILGSGLDILVVRELTGGIYFGKRGRLQLPDGSQAAFDTEQYSTPEIDRVLKVAFEAARLRGRRVTSVDKANVLESSRLWRERANAIAAKYPDVTLNHFYVDNAAMQLVRSPGQFDVIVTGNMFGDILSDEASMLTGSIGMLPSASLGEGQFGLYEPVHGSAPDIAGKDTANPCAAILSSAMLLRYSLCETQAADAIERAVKAALATGARTADLGAQNPIGTRRMGALIIEKLMNDPR